jgi:glycosyltransferase involved in cell wall biosynthesis
MKIALVTGACEPGQCGVGDYVARLAVALQRTGVGADILWQANGGLADLPRLLRTLRGLRPDLVHIHYPCPGFGRNLGPQGLALAVRGVVTIHEASMARLPRKLSLYPFGLRAKHVVFTSEAERGFSARWAPWIVENSSVIPVGSNVERQPCGQQDVRSFRDVVHFSLTIPKRGLEAVLELAALAKQGGHDLTVRAIGNRRPEHSLYADELRHKSKGLPIVWEQGLSEEEVGRRLTASWIAYLPYPDGASERRTGLKAALASGMAVVTTRGPDTPADLESVARFCSSPSEALAVIRELVENPMEIRKLADSGQKYAARFSWEAIAQRHVEVYQRVVGSS